ncbi:MAG: peptidyl-prolyl cis-trans isomerase [Gemmatimonadaceae bacterium]|nr:peptidyl-prolyl cis-trans isomerase [Gemmatimonadaceae bacterium]
MRRLALAAIAVVATAQLAGCNSGALSAHADTVAKAGSQELTVKKLSELLGASKVPLRKDVVRVVADLWVNYQLLAKAGAAGDSLNETKLLDSALWAPIANARARKFFEVISKTWAVTPTTDGEARYNSGEVLAASHILFRTPEKGVTPQQLQELRGRADSVRKVLTAANFAQLATRFSQDPGSAQQGGALGAFPKGIMAQEFENALKSVKPGEISGVVQSRFGFHIIYRPLYPAVAQNVAQLLQQRGAAVAESTYWSRLEAANTVTVKSDAPKMARDIVGDLDSYRGSNMVIGSSKRGDFTARQLVRWIDAYPPEQGLVAQIQNAPDTIIPTLVKNFMRNELFLAQADSAKVDLTEQEKSQIRAEFRTLVINSWTQLGVAPNQLTDSAKTPETREALAVGRVNTFLENMLVKDGAFVPIARSMDLMLRMKYPGAKIVDAGVDRALEAAQKLRGSADSTRAANRPASAVPMPGEAPAGALPAPAPAKP